MHNKKIKVYDEVNGNIISVDEKSAQTKSEVDQVLGDKYQTLLFLKSNPFFYNHDMDKDKVKSLEEYIVIYKKRENSFGEFIHSSDFSKKEKIKIIKKSFKFWNKDYNKQRKESVSKGSNALKAVEIADIKKFSFLQTFLLLLGFIILVITINIDSQLWVSFKNINLGFYLYEKITKLFNIAWIPIVGTISLYLFVITLLYLLFYNEIIKNYKSHYKENSKIINRTKSNLKKEQKKNSKKSYNYYMNNVKKGKLVFPGVKIKDVAPGVLNLDFYNQVSEEIVQKTGKIKKRKWFFVTSKYLFLALCLLSFVFMIGAIVFQIIIG